VVANLGRLAEEAQQAVDPEGPEEQANEGYDGC
jgi:hypothetical protein